MAVHIRLSRAGTKKRPFYRVVVTDQRSPRGGKFLENIGTFDPSKEMKVLTDGKTPLHIDRERLAHWTGRGAQPSETLGRLLKASAKAEAAAK
jgi:small subunit ribosomal protein S16